MSTKKTAIKNIKIIDAKTGQFLTPCSYYVANKKVINNSAVWVNKNTILLLITYNDSKKINKEVIHESNSICYICGDKIPQGEETIDHVIPKGLGGPEIKINKKCCCKRCNNDKNRRTLKQYLYFIKKNRKKYKYISDEQFVKLEKHSNIIENKIFYFIKSMKYKD